MAQNLKDITCLVIDNGLFVDLAVVLSRYYKTVYYYTDANPEYPLQRDLMTGYGLDEIERISDFWEVIDEVDLIVFPDTSWGDLTDYLRSKNYRVWGGGRSEQLETDRVLLKTVLKNLKLPVTDYKVIIGMDNLRKYLKENGERYIKSNTRADMETFHHINYKLTEPYLNILENQLGAAAKVYTFVVESPIDGKYVHEVGMDSYCIDGQIPDNVMVGTEIKNMGYCGIIKPYNELPKTLTECIDALHGYLKRGKYRQWISTENRVKGKDSYLGDATMRMPDPPGSIEMEIISNLGEVIYYGAEGTLKQPVYEAKYAIEITITSTFAVEGWQPIYFPEKDRRWYKFRNLCKIDGTYYVIPHMAGACEVGSIVGIGDDLGKIKKDLIERASKVEGYCVDIDLTNLDKAVAEFEESLKLGII